MTNKIQNHNDSIVINDHEYFPSYEGKYEILAAHLKDIKLGDIPLGIKITVCNRIIGTDELYAREPYCHFERAKDDVFLGHGEAVFVRDSEEKIDVELSKKYFQSVIENAKKSLISLLNDDLLLNLTEAIYKEIAHLYYTIILSNQLILEAEKYMGAILEKIHNGLDRPLLFICHASEDKIFVEKLVQKLDSVALHAWYDKREVFVGESIVEEINDALAEMQYFIVVLSPQSIKKPWLKRELNSTLMRKLSKEHVVILPVLIEKCKIPALISDLKYADFTNSFKNGFNELISSIRRE